MSFKMVDPLADQFPSYTPYHYVHNNPINLIDPTGMSAVGFSETTWGSTTASPCANGGSGEGCPDAAGGSKKRGKIKINLPFRTTTTFKDELRVVSQWTSSSSNGQVGSTDEGDLSMTYQIPKSLEGQRAGDVVSVTTDPKTKLTHNGGEDGSAVGHPFNATVQDGTNNSERPLYATQGSPNAGANPGDRVIVTAQSRPGDFGRDRQTLNRLQSRRINRLHLSMTISRVRTSVTHTRRLFGIPLGSTTRLVPAGRNPR